jgi:uncharacterized membrane protein YhaH (DUF805 family)
MKKYLKIFVAVLIVFVGAVATSFYLQHAISFTSVLIGLAGFVTLYPAIGAYVKWFDNLFGE